MLYHRSFAPVLGLFIIAWAGCDSGYARFAPPGDYPALTVAQALEAAPGRYNVEGYVVPAQCDDTLEFSADCEPAYAVFEFLYDDPPQLALVATTDAPGVLRERVLHRLSINVERVPETTQRRFTIIGAERLD